MFDFLNFKKELSNLAGALHQLELDISKKKKEVVELQTSALAPEDLDKFIDALVGAKAREYTPFFENQVKRLLADPMKMSEWVSDPNMLRQAGFLTAVNFGHGTASPLTMEIALFALLKEPLKESIKEHLKGVQLGKPGPVMKQRLPMIQKLEAEIAELEETRKKLHEQSAAAGITL